VLGEDALHRRVNGEWSFVETRRHLIFVVDKWLGDAVLGVPQAFHPIGLPAALITDGVLSGVDVRSTFAEVEEVLAGRIDTLWEYAATATQEDLDRVGPRNPAPGSPPPAGRTAIQCLRVIFNDGWEHHRFAVRDLAALEGPSSGRPA
jgi:hypothetical protein